MRRILLLALDDIGMVNLEEGIIKPFGTISALHGMACLRVVRICNDLQTQLKQVL